MAPTLCTSAAVKLKAGANAPVLTDAEYTQLIEQAEGFINAHSKYDYVTAFAALPSVCKKMLEDGAACYAAVDVVKNDMSGYSSKETAQVTLNVNWNRVVEIVNLLRDYNFNLFVQTGKVA